MTHVACYKPHVDILLVDFLPVELLSETLSVGFVILDLDIVDVNAVGHTICRTYYVCRLDLNL